MAPQLATQPLWRDFVYQSEPQPFNALRARPEALLDALEAPQPISQAQYDADLALIVAEEKALLFDIHPASYRAHWLATYQGASKQEVTLCHR